MPIRTQFAKPFGSVRSASDPYNPMMVNGTASSFPNGDPFPYTFNPKSPRFLLPASIECIGTNVQWPYIYQFNLAVQRQLPWQVALTAAYVGTISRDVPTMIDGNYAPYVPGISGENSGSSGTGGYNARRPYDQNATGTGTLGQNIFLITNQTASYHSLQICRGTAALAQRHGEWLLRLESCDTKLQRVGDRPDDRAGLREPVGGKRPDGR